MKPTISWAFIFQCLVLVTLLIRIPEAVDLNPASRRDRTSFKLPDGLLEAEKHGLADTNNHKLGVEEYVQPVKHLIPFDKHHFDFSDEDWSVFDLEHEKGDQMIVSVSADIKKELTISTIIKPMSNIIIMYQIHLTSNNGVNPTFTVFHVTNGLRTLLKMEILQEEWKTSVLHIHTKEADSELLFVGVLNDPQNKIALHSFTVQDVAGFIPHRYGQLPSLAASEDLLTGSDSHGDSFINENEPVFHLESIPQGLGKKYFHPNASSDSYHNISFHDNAFSLHLTENPEIHIMTPIDAHGNLQDNSSYISYSNSSLSGHDYEDFEHGNVEEPVYDANITGLLVPLNATDENESQSANSDSELTTDSLGITESPNASNFNDSLTHETSEPESTSSVTQGVFNFFIVVIICSIAVVGYLFWRRRQNQKEDEIPVFSRTSIEHGNPTFNDSEINTDNGINRENQLNYRSIE